MCQYAIVEYLKYFSSCVAAKLAKKKVWAIICLYKTITKIARKWGC